MKRWYSWCAVVVALLAAAAVPVAHAEDDFLDPEAAFALQIDGHAATPVVRFHVADGYHLYRDRLSVGLEPASAQAQAVALPHGQQQYDATFGKQVEILRGVVDVPVPLAARAPVTLHVQHQGCADKGLCYPPAEHAYRLAPKADGGWSVSEAAAADAVPVAAAAAPAPEAAPEGFAAALKSGSLWRVGVVFLVAGLLLAFTPCVLPMIPILSSIIVGQAGPVSRGRGFSLALAYALGMALVYTAFGMVAGLVGEGLAGWLQNAWVLGGFALLLVALSLSMFGVYELQMPSALQSRVTQWSGRLQGGQHAGVFVMGGLSALIVGPCVAAPLAGALVYISQTRDVVIGGVALFSLACGMSVPLLLVGLSAGSLLPKAGGWMERVKHGFGVLLLAVALWMVSPVLPSAALMLLVAGGLLGLAAYLGAFAHPRDGFAPHAAKAVGVMCALLATMELTGVASGGREPLQPLKHFALQSAEAATRPAGLRFDAVRSLPELSAAVQRSQRPVMVDFYADWCVSCKELDTMTFGDAAVQRRLSNFTLLRIDVTHSSAQDRELLKQHGLFGPPALLFFRGGAEVADARVVGYQAPEVFLRTLDRVDNGAPATAL